MGKQDIKPASWIASLYIAEGIPNTAIVVLSVIFLKKEGLTNSEIALYTSWLYLPWTIKPIWSPLVEMFKNSKFWITTCQIVMGALFAMVGLSLELDSWLKYSIILLWLAAFTSATHDIAADGYYINALNKEQQAFWVGIRSTFFKIAMWICQGGLVMLAGYFEEKYSLKFAWQLVFSILGIMMALLGVYHIFVVKKIEKSSDSKQNKNILTQLKSYIKKDNILLILGFLLLYRLGEAQLSKMSAPFLLDSLEAGGLGLSTAEIGSITGTWGLFAMSIGGILGGIAISRKGLKFWLIPMILILNVPDILYFVMAIFQTQNYYAIATMISVEQFGYGFGFTAYSMFMLLISKGEFSTSHFSISTAFMAAGMMLPGMISGSLQKILGYPMFFIWVVACTIPSLILAFYIKRTKYLDDDKK